MIGCYWLNEDRLPSKLFVGWHQFIDFLRKINKNTFFL